MSWRNELKLGDLPPDRAVETHAMRTIILIAVITILLLELSDALPKSSVGGPMAMLMIFFLAMLAVGLYEAWSQKRDVLGWVVSIVAAGRRWVPRNCSGQRDHRNDTIVP
jgi:uncharacterized membrane protein